MITLGGAPVALRSGPLELLLVPAIGGGIARFDWSADGARIPIMWGADAPQSVLDCASFPLVPYSNRVRGGRFTFRGREVVLAPNMAGDASPLHGQGWLAPWTVEDADDTSAELSFAHASGEWPWAYEAWQNVRLDEGGLDLVLTCRNASDDPMPCGLGQHPYFPCTADTRLDTAVTGAWTIDSAVLPVELVPASGRYDLANRAICGQQLDNGFEGWGGEARITNPGAPFSLRMTSPDAARFQVYSPTSGGLFVAEPVQAANAALNEPEERWPEFGLAVLEPGATARLRTRFEIIPA